MLRSLDIRDMLLIEALELEFQPGLNVLTGETGAGKSILLDSLGFVLGWRGRADLVRQGAEKGEVTAVFDLTPDHPAHAILTEAGLPNSDDLFLRRTTTQDGRKTAYVNDRRCSGEVLRQLSDCLLELHGQHDDRGLLNPKGHLALLDDFANSDLSAVSAAWKEKSTVEKQLKAARLALAEAEKDAEYLRHSVKELQDLDPQMGEEDALDKQRRLMQSAERIRDNIAKAAGAISATGAEGMVIDALGWIREAADQAEGKLDEPEAALNRALEEVANAQKGVEDCLSALSFNPNELEQAEERLFAIRGLARKHNIQPDQLPDLAADLAVKVDAIDSGAGHIAGLEAQAHASGVAYDKVASMLSKSRKEAAKELDRAMAAELAPLKLERAVFTTEITTMDAGAKGNDAVIFLVATNPGAPAGPLNKIASGGELSRFLLALKVCLTANASEMTMIFDEIDRGVGGATADAVGRRLAALSKRSQVLVVTHAPQVAARGDHQWLVAKSVENNLTRTDVLKLSDEARVQEIARMLAGDVITPEATAAAETLLAG